ATLCYHACFVTRGTRHWLSVVQASDALLPFFFLLDANLLDLHSFPTRRSSDLTITSIILIKLIRVSLGIPAEPLFRSGSAGMPRSEERFSRNAETDLVCRLLREKKKAPDCAYNA